MQKKVAEEGAKAEKAFDGFMCYCDNADGTLGKSISDAETRIPQLESSIKEAAATKKQMEADLKTAQEDRVQAKDAIAEATGIREKEAKAYAKTKSDAESNIGALSKAIPAIEKGMSSAFLQTSGANVLRQVSESAVMESADREALAAFLSESTEYAPKSGEIVGILKTLHDEMTKDFADATSEEDSAKASFDSLVASKKKEIDALTKAIESKTARVGQLGVKVAQEENDLEDTQEGLAEDKKFLANLAGNCEKKKKEWAAYKSMQAQEQVALADTIKILNDDDALELFKKTLPASASSFMQVQVTSGAVRRQAMQMLKAGHKGDPRLDLIELAMHGGKMGFDKIIKMIDNLVVDLKAEQGVDSDKKAYCEAEFDKAEDKKKGLDLDISDLEKSIEDGKESIASLKSELAALADGIKALDKSVAEATATRKAEHDDYVETLAANTAAKDILAFAKNRLNKFYNPKMYKAPPARELELAQSAGGAAPPPPPEANLAYKKGGESSNGVLAMIDTIVADLDKEIQTMEVDEKDAQSDYETLMSDSSAKRAQDSKAITDKEGAKAETEVELQSDTDTKKSKTIEAMETAKYIGGLHEECDWLLKNFDARKAARTGEIDALGKAKAVLSGADYSLVQTSSVRSLRGSA
jgi:chromosome segregation ATPase